MLISIGTIELKLPFKAEFVSVARLTASGVASRAGFNSEDVEDIKEDIDQALRSAVGLGAV